MCPILVRVFVCEGVVWVFVLLLLLLSAAGKCPAYRSAT
jgi:hypothetical protein